MSLVTELAAKIKWVAQSALDLSNVNDSSSVEYKDTLGSGTNTDESDVIWHDTRTLTTGNNDDLDLTALTQTIFGSTVTKAFAEVCGIYIRNKNTTAGQDLTVGGSGGNEWSAPFGATGDKVNLPADGLLLLTNPKAGWAVTNGSADTLRIGNASGNTVTYDIVIWGRSA